MITEINDTNIYVGDHESSLLRSNPDWAVVNAAKTVHCEIMGWDNRPPRDHPNYLSYEDGQLLSFNWVDGEARLYALSGAAEFNRALDFIDQWRDTKKVLITCDKGESRSPTVALLYLAKRLDKISDKSFAHARIDFEALYPENAPSGIADFVSAHWSDIA